MTVRAAERVFDFLTPEEMSEIDRIYVNIATDKDTEDGVEIEVNRL